MHYDDVEWIQEARYMGQGLDPLNAVTNILTIPVALHQALCSLHLLTERLQQEFLWTNSLYLSLQANNYIHTNVGCWLT
jgi:hypothetical protein